MARRHRSARRTVRRGRGHQPRTSSARRCSWSGLPERRTLDLGTLARAGVDLVGRLVGVTAGALQFSGSLRTPDCRRRPEAGASAGPDRRIRRAHGARRRRATRSARADPDRHAADRRELRHLRHGDLGDRIPTPLPLAGGSPPRPQGRDTASPAVYSLSPASTCWGCRSPGAASRVSSTVSVSTRSNSARRS